MSLLPPSALSFTSNAYRPTPEDDDDDWVGGDSPQVNALQEKPKSRFFASGSDSESNASSTQNSPAVATPPTPATLVCHVISQCHTSLTPNSSKTLKDNLGLIGQKKGSPSVAVAAKKIGKAIDEVLFGSDKDKLATPTIQSAHIKIKQSSDLQMAVRQVREFQNSAQHLLSSPPICCLPVSLPNLEHIIKGDLAGGRHYASDKEPQLQNLQFSTLSPWVFSATIKNKFSSFFNAKFISTEILKNILLDPKRVILARDSDRVLYKSQFHPTLIESYERNCFSTSAYPIFFHANFKAQSKFEITDTLTLNSHEVLNAAIELILKNKFRPGGPIKYHIPNVQQNGSTFVVDIAPAFFDKTKVKSGIYFFIPAEFLVIAEGMEPILEYFARPK